MATMLAPRATDLNHELLADARDGLAASPKRLPSKWFYDAEGSRLFELICDLPEYHVTRAELGLMGGMVAELAAALPSDVTLIEFGSGASVKTRLLLDAASQILRYVPIDISASAVAHAGAEIARDYPGLSVVPLVGDFSGDLRLPLKAGTTAVGYFPGSTIGNLAPAEAAALLSKCRDLLGDGAKFVLGLDHARDANRLVRAYDDAAGVTAAFNKNLLTRLNEECDADFELDDFGHRSLWNAELGRVEMHLMSLRRQTVTLAGTEIDFTAGETIHTESSYKYLPSEITRIAEAAGWTVEAQWASAEPSFGIFLLGTEGS